MSSSSQSGVQSALPTALEAFTHGEVQRAHDVLDWAIREEQESSVQRDVNRLLDLACMRAAMAAMEGATTIAELTAVAAAAPLHAVLTCYLEGLSAMAKSNMRTARLKFDECRRRDGHFMLAALGLAAVHLEAKEYVASFAQYREVLRVLGTSHCPPVVRVGMGLCYYYLHRLDGAQRCLERARQVHPEDQLALLALLVVYLDRRMYAKVTETIAQLHRMLPQHALILLKVGDVMYFRMVEHRHIKASVRPLRALLARVRRTGTAEECAMANFQEGRLLLLCCATTTTTRDVLQLQQAQVYLESALRVLPTLLAARIHYARLLLYTHRVEDGLQLLSSIHAEHPEQKEVLQLLAVHASRHAQHALALRYCRRLTDGVAQGDVRSWILAAWCARLDGAQSRELFSRVIRIHRELNLAPDWQLLANMAVLSGDASALQGLLDRELGADFMLPRAAAAERGGPGVLLPLPVSHVPLVYNLALLLDDVVEGTASDTRAAAAAAAAGAGDGSRRHDRGRARALYVFLVKCHPCFRLPYFRLHALAAAEGHDRQAVAWLTLLRQVTAPHNRPPPHCREEGGGDEMAMDEDGMTRAQIAHLFFRARRYRGTVELLREGHYLASRPRTDYPARPMRDVANSTHDTSMPSRRRRDGGDEVERRETRRRRDPVALALAATYLWCSQQRSRDDRRFLARAKELFMSVLRHDKGNILAAHGLACCLGLEGDYDRCQSMLNRVGEVTPTVPGVLTHHYGHMANVKMLSESYLAAMDYLTRMEHRTPQQSSCLAFCLASQNRYEEAMALLEQAMQTTSSPCSSRSSGGRDRGDQTAPQSVRNPSGPPQPQQREEHIHVVYNLTLVSCAAFLHRVAVGGVLTVEDGRSLRALLERGLSLAARVLHDDDRRRDDTDTDPSDSTTMQQQQQQQQHNHKRNTSTSAAVQQSSHTMRVCRVFLKSVCAYALRVYEHAVEQLLRLGQEMVQEQNRDAQRWADTFARYRAEMTREESQREWEQRQRQMLRLEVGKEVLQSFQERRARDPLKLFDPDLIQASLAELAREETECGEDDTKPGGNHDAQDGYVGERDENKSSTGGGECDGNGLHKSSVDADGNSRGRVDADDVGDDSVNTIITDTILAGMQLQLGELNDENV